MNSERARAIRDWGNFALTALIFIGIPVGMLVLRNQKLEMQAEFAKQYQTIESARSEHMALNATDQELRTQVAEMRKSLDVIIRNQQRVLDKLQMVTPP